MANQLSYGHSDGRIDTKAKLIDGHDQKGDRQVDRPSRAHCCGGRERCDRAPFVCPESETDGKPTGIRIGALQVWQRQDGNWKLLAQQG